MYQTIILKPVLTEKMAILQERENKYGFFVSKSSNKLDIKKAIEMKFDVSVIKVGIINMSGKIKNMTMKSSGKTIRTKGSRASYKKAIVTLHKDSVIDYNESKVAS